MAILKLGDQSFSVAPFHLGKLEQAADLIDMVNTSLASRDGSWKALTASYRPIMAIASIGLSDTDGPKTADELLGLANLKDAEAIFLFFTEVLAEAGLQPAGESVTVAEAGSALPSS